MRGADALAQAAEQLAGCRFRLHGRDPATGLDCIGLFACAWAAAGGTGAVPGDYTLRMRDAARLHEWARQHGFGESGGQVRRGDVLAFAVGPAQAHLAVAVGAERLIHAHAGLRRVVSGPAPADWRKIGHWRWPDGDGRED